MPHSHTLRDYSRLPGGDYLLDRDLMDTFHLRRCFNLRGFQMSRPDASAPFHLDIVSDTICPWCYVGKRRLEEAVPILKAKASRSM